METPALEKIWQESQKHFQEDKDFQGLVLKQFERMEPMVKAFEDRKITKMVFDRETNTLYIYAKRIITIGGAIALIWGFIKYLLLK